MNSVHKFVRDFANAVDTVRMRVFELAPHPHYEKRDGNTPTVAIVSPHPDDECIIGGLALRLGVECGWRVVNLAVTQGSNPDRITARAEELRAACNYLGFECHFFGERGLQRINPEARANDPAHWTRCVAALREAFETLRPALILTPHARDAQITHVGTHWLTLDALAAMPEDFAPTIAFTEYWSTIEQPNVMVELSSLHVAQLVSALTFHVGEVARNPYHLSLPAWMMDNVRRGSERVGAPGAAAVPFNFATLYELHARRGGVLRKVERNQFVSLADACDHILR